MCVILGGNSVESAAPGRVKDFVSQNGGHTVITSILIANNGIAAVKEIRSIRKWLEFTSHHSFLPISHEEKLETGTRRYSADIVFIGLMKHLVMKRPFRSL